MQASGKGTRHHTGIDRDDLISGSIDQGSTLFNSTLPMDTF